MEENLDLYKTEYIKARVTPRQKTAVIEKGARLGLDQTGYIMHAIHRLDMDNEESKKKDTVIARQAKELEIYRDKFAAIQRALRPIRHAAMREPIQFNGKHFNIKSDVELIEFLASIFKLTPEEHEN